MRLGHNEFLHGAAVAGFAALVARRVISMQGMSAQHTVRTLIDNGHTSDPAELRRVFAELPAVTVDFMIGDWRGGELPSGHPMDGMLEQARWYGKSFRSATDVQPLVCLDENGERYSNVELGKGEATLRMVEFDGTLTASMIYDGQPVIDHFAGVDGNTVMGVMTGKKLREPYFYFYLERTGD